MYRSMRIRLFFLAIAVFLFRFRTTLAVRHGHPGRQTAQWIYLYHPQKYGTGKPGAALSREQESDPCRKKTISGDWRISWNI